MKKHTFKIIAACAMLGASLATAGGIPGWFPAGSHPNEYEMTVDHQTVHGGSASASLKSITAKTSGFGTLMQTCRAGDYRGKRVQLSGYVRTQDVKDWAGLWLRVDGAQQEMLSFDNMHDRPVKGTTGWTKCEIVLDVPAQADKLAFGLLLSGGGQAWMDDLKFEIVGPDVPTTGAKPEDNAPAAPRNLNFEE